MTDRKKGKKDEKTRKESCSYYWSKPWYWKSKRCFVSPSSTFHSRKGNRFMATEKQTVAVLGAGNIGGTLGRKWIATGHQVVFGVSDPNGKNAQRLRRDLGDTLVIGSVADALSSNPDVVVMAVPGTVMDTIIPAYAKRL